MHVAHVDSTIIVHVNNIKTNKMCTYNITLNKTQKTVLYTCVFIVFFTDYSQNICT